MVMILVWGLVLLFSLALVGAKIALIVFLVRRAQKPSAPVYHQYPPQYGPNPYPQQPYQPGPAPYQAQQAHQAPPDPNAGQYWSTPR